MSANTRYLFLNSEMGWNQVFTY